MIAAEDTRHTLKLLNHLGIKKPLISYYKEQEKIKSDILIDRLLKGENIAIVSDAGTPIISDPGEEITREAIEKNLEVISIPGPCALITGVIASGMNAREFLFMGFLPVNKKEKRAKIEEIRNIKKTIIFYEAPHKLIATLTTLQEILGDRYITLARELTKIHEEYLRGNISEIITSCAAPKGEYVIIIEGAKTNAIEEMSAFLNQLTLEEHYKFYEEKNYERKQIIKQIAKDRNVSKNEIYKHFIK